MSQGKTGKVIELGQERVHAKASEAYVDVTFHYPDVRESWQGSVPYHYRRTGVFAETPAEVISVVKAAYAAMHPSKRDSWLKEQERFWRQGNRRITRPFFEALKDCQWKCQRCQLPRNPNWARRTQDIKEMGYTLATHTARPCQRCRANTTHLIMLRLPRGGETGYETWSPALRRRILDLLGHRDAYESCVRRGSLLPDHKFPEIRWDQATRQANPEGMSDAEIRKKFQLLTNQRNQQKREVCRTCFQTGKRGTPFGVKFFYSGGEDWPQGIPRVGKKAEQGCIGCGWYDLAKWREALNAFIASQPTPPSKRHPSP